MKKSEMNDIDLIFRSHFAGSEVPVANRQALWDRITGSRRRSRMIPFLFLGFLISFISYASYSNYNNDNVEVMYNVINSDVEFINTHDSYSINSIEEINAEEQSDGTRLMNNTLEKIEETVSSRKTTGIIQGEGSSATIGATFGTNNFLKEKSERFASILNGNSNNIQIAETILAEESKVDSEINWFDSPEITSSEGLQNKENKKELIEKFEAAPFVSISIGAVALEESPVKNTMKKCTTEGGGQFFADVYTNVGIPIERIALNDLFADQIAYKDAWEARYHTLPSLSAGISLGYESPIGIGLSIGAEYQRIESEYRTIQTITERVTIYDPEAYFYYDANNEVVWVGDSVTAISSFDRTVSLGNTSNLIHLPVEISYTLYNKAPWKVRASAAAIFNFSLNYRGQYLRSDQSLIQIDQTNNDTYLSKNLGLGFEGGAYLGYQLADSWELYFGPRFRYNNKSHWTDTEAINTSRHFISLRTGLRYHF